MNLPEQTVQGYGVALTSAGTVASFITAATPILQFGILVITLVVGVLTAIYTWKRIRAKKTD